MAAQFAAGRTTGSVPQADDAVFAARGQQAAVGTEGHAPDTVGVALQRHTPWRTAGQRPQAQRVVFAGAGQQPAVGAECDRADGRAVALQGTGQRRAADGVVQQHGVALLRDRDGLRAVEAQHRAGQGQRALQPCRALERQLQPAVTLVGRAQPVGGSGHQQRHVDRRRDLAVEHGAALQYQLAQVGGLRLGQQTFAALPQQAEDQAQRCQSGHQRHTSAAAPGLAPGLSRLFGDARCCAGTQKGHCWRQFDGVLPGPGGIGPGLGLPHQCEVQFGVAPQPAAAMGLLGRGVGQAPQLLRHPRFVLRLGLQALPDAHQAFVGDVHDRGGCQRLGLGRHEERPARVAEDLDHLCQRLGAGLGDGAEISQPGRAADTARVGGAVGEGAEHPSAQGTGGVIGQCLPGLLGVAIEGAGHRAHRRVFVVPQPDRAGTGADLPHRPGPAERMLQDRELVGVVADVVDQTRQQHRVDARAGHAHRSGDGHAALVSRHARHEGLTAAHGLRQPVIGTALAQKVRAHGQHHVDWQLTLPPGLQQQADQRRRVVGRGGAAQAPVAEQLFELVDHDQQVHTRCQPRLAHRVDQAQAAHAQRRGDDLLGAKVLVGHGVCVVLGEEHARRGERTRQRADGVAARPAHGHAPGRAGLGQQAAVERRAQTAVDER